jgi:Cu/Ag efflux protein CusF
MMNVIIALSLAAVVALGTAACGNNSGESGNGTASGTAGSNTSAAVERGSQSTGGTGAETSAGATAEPGEVKEYTFHGTVRKVDTERQMITVDHEKIGDYMAAMTMPFKVADPALLNQVKVGDETHFTLRVAGDHALITKIEADHEGGERH